MSGYVAMSRNWQDHDIFDGDEFSRRDAWAWLISQAAWKAGTARIKGAKVDLQRGELCFSQRFLANKWGWSKSRTDRFIASLRDEGMIETRSKIGAISGHVAGQGQSIISICNYDKYQPEVRAERGNVEPISGATAGQQRGKEEEGNKGNKIERAGKPAQSIPIPDGWHPEPFDLGTQSRRIVDGWTTGKAAIEVEQFRAHHGSQRTKFVDWQKAWSTWVLNSEKFARPAAASRDPNEGKPLWQIINERSELDRLGQAAAGSSS